MPFRLLGMVADPDQASAICGHTFARYAAGGVEITLASASAAGWSAQAKDAYRRLGVRDIVLFDYPRRGLKSSDLEEALTDLMTSLRPHVVVVDASRAPMAEAATAAFTRARHGGGSGTLPAKFYVRASGHPAPVEATTRVSADGAPPELFVRVYPSPWVTGVLEQDLFAGIRDMAPDMTEELAS